VFLACLDLDLYPDPIEDPVELSHDPVLVIELDVDLDIVVS
jgi:hypothetical protein